ncbi:MAG: hypothetical protein C0608_04685 [Deltaproteobacteria bacterium]|nr:MAG: hypothetical protein C0608_04685 [Deltaproteobacteria bacterium]
MNVTWRFLVTVAWAVSASLFMACAGEHMMMEIPPPGGCDRCHKADIGGDWSAVFTTADPGFQGGPGISEGYKEKVLALPVHQDTPEAKLSVYLGDDAQEAVEPTESGVQCFLCHRAPTPEHRQRLGGFPHPWGKE